MVSSTSGIFIDDTDPRVHYESESDSQWRQLESDNVTRHQTSTAGARASLSFTGIGVHVIGMLEPSEDAGKPTTTYFIDGKVAGIYIAPFVPTPDYHLNVTFFSSRGLAPGNHTIAVMDMNGTSPNTFRLDYFLVDIPSGPSTAGVGLGDPKSSTASSSEQSVVSASETSTVVTSVTAVSAPGTSATITRGASNTGLPHTGHLSLGAVVGATVASGALLALLALVSFCIKRRRHFLVSQAGPTTPYTSSRNPIATPSSSCPPSTRNSMHSIEMLSTRAVVVASHFGHRSSTASPDDLTPGETVNSQPELDVLRPSPRSALLAPLRPAASSSAPPMPVARASSESPISEKPPWPSKLPTTRALPRPPPQARSLQASSSTPSTASPGTPPTVLPFGMWHAPPDGQGPAHSLFRSLFSNGSRANLALMDPLRALRAADSGLRLYDDTVLPPPYTRD